MTTSGVLPTPEDATVVEVDCSLFFLEWLQRETLAGAAALFFPAEDTDAAEDPAAR